MSLQIEISNQLNNLSNFRTFSIDVNLLLHKYNIKQHYDNCNKSIILINNDFCIPITFNNPLKSVFRIRNILLLSKHT